MITLYSTNSCKYCKDVKSLLDSRGVEYQTFMVDQDEEKLQELRDLGYSSVPVLKIRNQTIKGFKRQVIIDALDNLSN